MVVQRKRYDEPYYPSNATIEFYTWFTTHIKEDNKPAVAHFQMLDHIYRKFQFKGVECQRGFSKSSLIDVYSTIWWCWRGSVPNFGEFHNILIVGDTVGQIETVFLHWLTTLEDNPAITKRLVIKKQKLGDDPTLKVYNKVTKQTFYLKGRGSGQKIRGTKQGKYRPDIVIIDDLENDENVESKESREKLRKWFTRALLPAVNVSHYQVIFIGTPLHEDALLIRLKNAKAWYFISLPAAEKFPCKKEEYVPAWADRFSYEDLSAIREAVMIEDGTDLSFKQEYMLITVDETNLLFDMEKVNKIPYNILVKMYPSLNFYITIDLAVSEKEGADYTSICVIGINDNGDWFIVDGFFGRVNPNITIKRLFEFVTMYRPLEVVVEAVAFQMAMKTFIQNEMTRTSKFFNINMLNRRSQSKLAVIKAVEPIVSLGKFWIVEPPQEKGGIDYSSMMKYKFMDELESEMRGITRRKILASHDDLIDSVAMLTLVDIAITQPVRKADRYVKRQIYNSYA